MQGQKHEHQAQHVDQEDRSFPIIFLIDEDGLQKTGGDGKNEHLGIVERLSDHRIGQKEKGADQGLRLSFADQNRQCFNAFGAVPFHVLQVDKITRQSEPN